MIVHQKDGSFFWLSFFRSGGFQFPQAGFERNFRAISGKHSLPYRTLVCALDVKK
jgi:hypothetical protein